MRKPTSIRTPAWIAALTFTGLMLRSAGVTAQEEKVDQTTIQKIREEGLNHSHVMDIAFHLTDASGNRLTASPGFMRAANWAKQQLTDWGLTGATLDPWGEFGKGWELQKSYLAMTAPYYKPLIAFPKAWCAGTEGPKSASVLLISATDSASLEKYKGQLAGKILIPEINDVYRQSFRPDADRWTDQQLDSMSKVVMKPVDTAELRRRLYGDDGSRPHPQDPRHPTPPHHPHRPMERRGRRPARKPGICEEDLCRSGHHAAAARS